MSPKPRVVYWFKQPTPYMVERFNAVADRNTINFEAWFDDVREPDRSWDVNEGEWRFAARYLGKNGLPILKDWKIPSQELRDTKPDLIIQECDRSHLAVGFLLGRVLAKRTAFRSLPNYDAWSERTWWREVSKHFLYRAVDGAKVPGPDGAAMTQRYGLPPERVSFVTQSVDIAHYAKARAIAPEVRSARREALGLRGCVFLYVGRIWSGKGLDYLFDAYRTVSQKHPEVSLLLVGDGMDETCYKQAASALPNVHFAGFVQKDELPEWYGLADVLVFPTLGDPNGLVVEEAMAAGLPVICSDSAGDIRMRLPDGVVGYVVPTSDAITLADRMLKLATDETLRLSFAEAAKIKVARYTPEQYAIDFEAFVSQVLASPSRRSPAAVLARIVGRTILMTASSRDPAARYINKTIGVKES